MRSFMRICVAVQIMAAANLRMMVDVMVVTAQKSGNQDQPAPKDRRHDIDRQHRFPSIRDDWPQGCDILFPVIIVEVANEVARQFSIPANFRLIPFAGRGNINLDTYLIECTEGSYLLQRINTDVFGMPDRVMNAMIASLEAQSRAVRDGHGGDWVVPELVPLADGGYACKQADGSVWRMMRFIPDTVSYKSLADVPEADQMKTAKEMGRGLGVYLDLTSSMDATVLKSALPGYRDTRLYFHQLHSAVEGCRSIDEVEHRLPDEAEVRQCTERHFLCALDEPERLSRRNDADLQPFIDFALGHEPMALSLQEQRERGEIRQVAIHGDTKIENFLFSRKGCRVRSLVDLDTIMPHSWLADWGDMLRSLTNIAGEKERDLSRVKVNREVYDVVTEGFLDSCRSATDAERKLMPQAVKVIALELGVRFLADYLRGDTYFQLGPGEPPDLNKVRAMVQLRLADML